MTREEAIRLIGWLKCTTNREDDLEAIDMAMRSLIESTNIETSEDEMKVIDDFLFRCWQLMWLDKYADGERREP